MEKISKLRLLLMKFSKLKVLQMEKFSKLRVMQWLGLLNRRFDFQRLTLEDSLICQFRVAIHAFLISSFALKVYASKFWPREDPIQLYLGSMYNYLDDVPKMFMSYIGLFSASWALSISIAFNHLNGKEDFLFWIKATNEIPTGDRRVAGISNDDNQKFWQVEKKVNFYWVKLMNGLLIVNCLILNAKVFSVPFPDVHWLQYALLQTLSVLHSCYFLFGFQHMVYTVSLFMSESICFLAKKFAGIERQIKRFNKLLNVSKRKLAANRQLAKLIADYNVVHVEMLKFRKFFRSFIGFNSVNYYGLVVVATFLAIFVDLRLKLVILSTMSVMFLAIIGLPFYLASRLPIQMNKTVRLFEFVAFHRSVDIRNKEKINAIAGVKDRLGYTCFDWFELDMQNALKITLEISTYFLLFFQGYLLYIQQL